jgi:amino-acid N-acetyltransferase
MDFVKLFRDSAPYLHAHRGSTLVAWLPGELLADQSRLQQLAQDLLLLHTLGIRLVLVPGCRPQIEARLALANLTSAFHANERITSQDALPHVIDAVGTARLQIETALSRGLANTPGSYESPSVVAGNFVTAQPLGVREGVDFQFTGVLRRVNSEAIERALDANSIVLVSAIGTSPSGDQYNLSSQALAVATSSAIGADKLVLFSEQPIDSDGEQKALNAKQASQSDSGLVRSAAEAVARGVSRVHLLDACHDGSLLKELFTRDGDGLLVSDSQYDSLHSPSLDDVPGILALVEPLEEAGILVSRSREQIELELDRFVVLERDGMVVGCAALAQFDESGRGELYCFAVHPDYRGRGLAGELLAAVEGRAAVTGVTQLFVLTTRTADWFRENGFESSSVDKLPEPRREIYNAERNALIYVKDLL